MNYKNIYRTVFVGAALCMATGCESYLDTSLDTYQTDETIATNRGTIWSFANAFYAPMGNGFSMLDDNLFAPASDEAMATSASSNASYFNKGAITPATNPISNLYKNYYEGIRAANYFLDYVKDGKGEALLALNRDTVSGRPDYLKDLASLNWYKAEAHIAKAYYYTELLKMYGGVPIVEETYEQVGNKMIARSSYDDVVDYIVNEIDTYKDQLAVNWDDFSDREGRFTLGAALAIKARALLYAASPLNNPTNDVEKWKKAAEAAKDIIDNPDLGYSLASDYGNYFLNDTPLSSSETIIAVRRGASNSLESKNYPIATPGGASGVTPSHNLVSAYEYIGAQDPDDPYLNRDPRLKATIVTNGSNWNGYTMAQAPGERFDMNAANASRTGYYLKKFLVDNLNLIQGQNARHHWIAYRYAEVLLNYAEAMNQAYGPDDNNGYSLTAREALQLVRDRASTSLPAVVTTDRDEFNEAVKHERRIELAFEDHRYWDLLRWKDAMTVLNEPIQGVKITKTGGKYNYETVTVGTRKFLERNYRMPFSRGEIANSNDVLVQNEGY